MAIQAKFLLLISVLIVLISGPARAAPPSPEETAELYYHAWLNFDRASMVRLSKEWGSSGSGQRYTDMDLVSNPVAWQRKYKGMHAPKEPRTSSPTSSHGSGSPARNGCAARPSLRVSAPNRPPVSLWRG